MNPQSYRAVYCDLCDTGVATSRCLECNEKFCKYCALAHQRGKTTKQHKIISEDFDSWKNDKRGKKNTTCKMHTNKDINMYCTTCSLFVCEDCVRCVHRKHTFGKLDEIAKQIKDGIFEYLMQLREKHVVQLKSKILKTQKYREEFEHHNKRIHDSIKQRTKELEAELHKIRDKLIMEFQKVQKENDDVLRNTEKELKHHMFQIEKMGEAFIEILNSASNVELLSAEHRMRSKIKSAASNIHFNPEVHLSHFISGNHAEETLQNSFGFVRRGEDFSSEFEENIDHKQCIFECNVISAFNHKGGDILSVCPINENEAWVHCKNENQNNCVDVFGKVSKTTEFDFFIDDFADMAYGDVMFSTYGEQRIMHLLPDGSLKEIVNTRPLHPRGLCITQNKGILACLMDDYTYDINSSSKRCVIEMANDGATINHIEFDQTHGRLFTVPYRVAENTNRHVCVIDRTSDTSGRLVVVDADGILRFTYNDQNSQHFIPNGVVCDFKGRILVSDFWDKLHILNSDGTLLQYLITEENKIEFPQSVGINKQGHIWLGCEGGNIFILSYRELGKQN